MAHPGLRKIGLEARFIRITTEAPELRNNSRAIKRSRLDPAFGSAGPYYRGYVGRRVSYIF